MITRLHECLLFSVANPVGLAVVQVASPYIVSSISRLPMMVRGGGRRNFTL